MAVYVCSQELCLCLLGFLQSTEGGALPRRLNAVRVCARGKLFYIVFCDKCAQHPHFFLSSALHARSAFFRRRGRFICARLSFSPLLTQKTIVNPLSSRFAEYLNRVQCAVRSTHIATEQSAIRTTDLT